MAATVSQDGISQALAALNYRNPESLKSRLVAAIQGVYRNHGPAELPEKIETGALIEILWGRSEDPGAVKACRKRLSSTKSAVNRDLKRLYAQGKNPEGVTIGRNNLFVMCDEAKDEILSSITPEAGPSGAATLEQIAESLQAIQSLLKKPLPGQEADHPETSTMLADLRSAVCELSERMRSEGTGERQGSVDDAHVVRSGGERFDASRAPAPPVEVDVPAGEGTEEEKTAGAQGGGSGAPESGGPGAGETVPDREAGQTPAETADGARELAPGKNSQAPADGVDRAAPVASALPGEGVVDDGIETVEADEEIDLVEDLPEEDVEQDVVVEDDDDEFETLIEEIDDDLESEAEVAADRSDEIDGMSGQDKTEGPGGATGVPGPGLEGGSRETGVGSGGSDSADDGGRDQADGVEEIDDADELEDLWEVDELAEEGAEVEEDDLEEVLEEAEEEGLPLESIEEDDLEEVVEEAGGDGDGQGTDPGLRGVGEPQGESVDTGPDIAGAGEEFLADPDAEAARARSLAETFDGYLGTMERFYNQFIPVYAGKYTVGSPEPGRHDRPEHVVSLETFYIGKFPVTNALFEIFVEKTGYVTTAERLGCATVYEGRLCRKVDQDTGIEKFICNGSVHSRIVKGAAWYQPLGPGSTLHNKRNHPVVQVSVEDAIAFAAWTGKRLPTEDEWEAAARTTEALALPWGDSWKPGCSNIEDHAIADTTPVDAFSCGTNALGVADTLGNVLEWTSDSWSSPAGGPYTSQCHVAKGGSWISERDVRLYRRFKVEADAPSNIVGFRCVVI